MSEFKEFQGKNLDEAITNACDHFNLNRDKLEIEIVSGGSTGVFGLVGKKNARVKARPRFVEKQPYDDSQTRRNERKPRQKPQEMSVEDSVEPAQNDIIKASEEVPAVKPESSVAVKPESEVQLRTEPVVPAVAEKPAEKTVSDKNEQVSAATDEPFAAEDTLQKESAKEASAEQNDSDDDFMQEDDDSSCDAGDSREGYTAERRNVMEGDPEEIAAAVREALEIMIEPIVQQKPKLEIEVGEDRVNVLVDDEENSGLIIGREGQTLSALQYLCNRMVSKKLQTSVRVQIDTGDYRERQDEKLRQLAWHLADKANNTGRVQSTKPLSSYHRRVVHMALQEDKQVNTRSKGDGPMKRVLILPKRGRGGRSGGSGGGYSRDRSGSDNYSPRSTSRYDDRRGQDSRGPQTPRGPQAPRSSAPRGPQDSRSSQTPRAPQSFRGPQDSRNSQTPRGPQSFRSPQAPRDVPRGNQAPRNTPVTDEDNFNNEYAPGGYHSGNRYAGYDPNAVSTLYSNGQGQRGNRYNNDRNPGSSYNRSNPNDRNSSNTRSGQSRYSNRSNDSRYGEKRDLGSRSRTSESQKTNSTDSAESSASDRYNGRY